MSAEDDPLLGAEEQMLAHEVEAFYALLRKVRSRLGARFPEMAETDTDSQTAESQGEVAVTAAFRQTLTEDPDARELAERVATFLRFGSTPTESAAAFQGSERARRDTSL